MIDNRTPRLADYALSPYFCATVEPSMSSPAAIHEVCVPDAFHGIVPVRGLKTIFSRIDGSLIMELNNRFMNKRSFPFLFQLSLFAFASLPAYQSCGDRFD